MISNTFYIMKKFYGLNLNYKRTQKYPFHTVDPSPFLIFKPSNTFTLRLKKIRFFCTSSNDDATKVQLFAIALTIRDNALQSVLKSWQDLYISRSFVAAKKQFVLLNKAEQDIVFLLDNFPIEELTDAAAQERILSFKQLWLAKFVGVQFII